ncbi:CLUMA_CG005303, isoform A [Clunio marinus]|uniref:CLUMA_CG005303, isoform A n=1 Tax=Clunio marinus TaxID=568069 RepID=A0A1J1HUG8_9DIPT|nr:CLUMA_CG005303, isoform A [Clunio marinus]
MDSREDIESHPLDYTDSLTDFFIVDIVDVFRRTPEPIHFQQFNISSTIMDFKPKKPTAICRLFS